MYWKPPRHPYQHFSALQGHFLFGTGLLSFLGRVIYALWPTAAACAAFEASVFQRYLVLLSNKMSNTLLWYDCCGMPSVL